MEQIGRFFAGQGLLMQLVFLTAVLVSGWFAIRPFERLRPYRGQTLVLLFVFWVGLLFYFLTYTFRVARFGDAATTAATMPRFWFAVLIPVLILTFISILKGHETPDSETGNLWRVGIVFAALVLSLSMFRFIGYYISSAFLLVVVMWVLGSREKIELIALPVCWVVFSYFFFYRLLQVRLPVGSLFAGILG